MRLNVFDLRNNILRNKNNSRIYNFFQQLDFSNLTKTELN
jgi:hypothetical protein